MSAFATIGKAKEEGEDMFAGMDETKMERALESLMRETEHINENDPRQLAGLMRKFSDKTGISLGDKMEEAISRMESGEDPDQIEKEMGDILESEDGCSFDTMKKKMLSRQKTPSRDEKLYEL